MSNHRKTGKKAAGADAGQTPAPEFDFGMTDLEERLAVRDGFLLRATILERLAELGRETRARLEEGIQPDEYAIEETTYAALAAAYDVISQFPTKATETSPGL